MQQVLAAAQPRALGHYTLIERLGAGGQGEVWRARDENRGVDIALKIISPALVRNPAIWAELEREHAITERLQHPAILQVMPPERFGDVVTLPMELACGGDLRRLRGAGYLEIVPVLIEMAEALGYAHERGVVHRDLKPRNVLFDGRGRVKLADFGVAAVLAGLDPPGAPKCPAGLSPFSASPEQLRGEPPTAADDIYGLGALAYELLSGHPPHYPHFDFERAQSERVPPLAATRQIPPELDQLVMRMLAKRAAQRPGSMGQVLDELDGTLNATLSFGPEGVEAMSGAPRPAVTARASVPPAAAAVAAPSAEPGPVPRSLPPPPPGTVAAPPRSPRWPYLALGMLCGAVLICAGAAAALYLLPRAELASLQHLMAKLSPQPAPRTAPDRAAPAAAAPAIAAVAPPAAPPVDQARITRLDAERAEFNRQLAALDARGAAMWDRPEVAAARLKAAESSGAQQAGGLALAQRQLDQARRLLASIQRKTSGALAAELADESRAGPLKGVLPLLADAQRAQAAGDYSRAAQDFSQALTLDPQNTLARAGLARVTAAFGTDNYARAVGAGYAALGAGRLDEARSDFQQALAYRANGSEATAGLARVSAAMQAGRSVGLRQQAAALERGEHWNQARELYQAALRQDPSLAFAQQGEAQAAARARLANGLQQLIDDPALLASPPARAQALTLLQSARLEIPSGPKLQSQIARLSQLLPQFSRPVPLNLVSDDATHVTIPSIGEFGTFARREIRLIPGTYTIIGTRYGYRDVRREFTVSPGDRNMTITVSCSEPI